MSVSVRASSTAAVLLFLLLGGTGGSKIAAKEPLTVARSIETTRVLSLSERLGLASDDEAGRRQVLITPDGKRFALMLVRGDLQRNGLWLEILSGSLDSLESAARAKIIASLFMSGLARTMGTGSSRLGIVNQMGWVDHERLAFLWGDASDVSQLYAVNLRTGVVEQLSAGSTDVIAFAFGPDRTLVYTARAQRFGERSAELLRKGFVVTSPDLVSLLEGHLDGRGSLELVYDNDVFVRAPGEETPRRVELPAHEFNMQPVQMVFSPDGRQLLLDASPGDFPSEWDRYTDPAIQMRVQDRRKGGPRSSTSMTLKQVFVVDLRSRAVRPLWNAPTMPNVPMVWSPDSRSVLIGPTVLPAREADAAALAGGVFAEVDVQSGRIRRVPVPVDAAGARRGVQLIWNDPDSIEVQVREQQFRFARRNGEWRAAPDSSRTPAAKETSARSAPRVRLELRQDLNTPPALYAVDMASGREQMIFDPNPGLLEKYTLGRVEAFQWKDPEGREWSGLLYHPVGSAAGERVPLVIQTHGHSPPGVFSLYGKNGPGLGPGMSVYAAQALANRGIAVLQMEDKVERATLSSPKEPQMYMAAYEAAIDALVARGLVERSKVGLVGFSRTGWHVEHAITFSDFPYAAALVSDNYDGSYSQAAAMGWPEETARNAGAPPFGEGLKTWLGNSPAFNADKVRTPLRMQIETGGVPSLAMAWEMFSRLRYLRKPVELYLIPFGAFGTHGVQNPAQCLAAQQGSVDWFDFWLNRREDGAPEKAEQYARWRAMRE